LLGKYLETSQRLQNRYDAFPVAQSADNPNQSLSDHDLMEVECKEALAVVRGSLLELYAALGVDPEQPQEASRKLGVNKNLAWKVSKILTADDGLSTVQSFPGGAGWEILLAAVRSAGGSETLVSRVRASLEAFEAFVTRHAGTRANLELILDSMGLTGGGGQLETSRQMAFQGNSGIWGVQVRARLTSAFVAPAKKQGQVDAALVGGMIGFRCLRPGISWPLFRFQSYHDDGRPMDLGEEMIEPSGGSLPMLLRRFSSPTLPPIASYRVGNYQEHVLQPTTVGNLGAFDCLFGGIVRGNPRYRTADDMHGEFASSVTMPVETLLFDVFVHRELEMPRPPEVHVYGRPGGGLDDPTTRREEYRVPLPVRCVELPGHPPVVATPLVPRYGDLVALVMERLGHPAAQYRGFRLTLGHPPMPSTVLLRWPLAEAPREP
jgi:hypothetical protein